MAQQRSNSGQFGFGRAVLGWSRKVYKVQHEVFQQSFIALMDEMQASCPKDTHFLMSSLAIGKNGTPRMTRDNPNPNGGPGSFEWDRATLVGIVESSQYGEKLYLGYTANYAGLVHDGHGGQMARPWVSLVAQRWRGIVASTAARIKDDKSRA